MTNYRILPQQLVLGILIGIAGLSVCNKIAAADSDDLRRLSQTCLAYKEQQRGFIDWKNATPSDLRDRELLELKSKSDIDNLKKQFQLMTEDSLEGRKFRWEDAMRKIIDTHCEYALSKREPEEIRRDLKSISKQYMLAEPK